MSVSNVDVPIIFFSVELCWMGLAHF